MDYTLFWTAYQNNDTRSIDTFLEKVRPRLVRFMRVHMNLDLAEAEDCVQQAILSFWQALEQGRIEKPEKLHTYLISACRNTYLNQQAKIREELMDDLSTEHLREPQQLKQLLDRERWGIIQRCIDELSDGYRHFIKYWFDHPNYEAESIAEHFNMSVSNAWTRKHRVIKKLKLCFEKKIEE